MKRTRWIWARQLQIHWSGGVGPRATSFDRKLNNWSKSTWSVEEFCPNCDVSRSLSFGLSCSANRLSFLISSSASLKIKSWNLNNHIYSSLKNLESPMQYRFNAYCSSPFQQRNKFLKRILAIGLLRLVCWFVIVFFLNNLIWCKICGDLEFVFGKNMFSEAHFMLI